MRIEGSVIPPERIVPEPEGVCPECHGRGWVVVPDGGAGTAKPCPCREKDVVPRLLTAAGVPERYRRLTLDNFQTAHSDPATQERLTAAKRVSRQYVDDFLTTEGGFTESGLIFVGPPGTGKTHLAAAVLQELVRRYRVRGKFVDFTALVHKIQATFDPSSLESKHAVLDPVIQAEVLVFDELGAQKPSDWVQDTLYLIINTRYTERRPTIFTTNYPLEDGAAAAHRPMRVGVDADVIDNVRHRPSAPFRETLGDRVSSRVVSRIFEMATPLKLKDHDYRREVKSHALRR